MRMTAIACASVLVLAGCDEKSSYIADSTSDTDIPDVVDVGDGGDGPADPVIEPPPPPECEDPDPPPTGPRVDFLVDCDPCIDTEDPTDCTVAEVDNVAPGHIVLQLNCRDSTGTGGTIYQVETFSDIPARTTLMGGERVWFRYFQWTGDGPWTPQFFSIKTETGKLLMAGIDAFSARPRAEPGDWYDPIYIEVIDGLCPTESFDCYDLERLSLEVTYGDYVKYVMDSTTETIGYTEPYHIQVDNAELLKNISCGSTPSGRFMFIVMRVPEI